MRYHQLLMLPAVLALVFIDTNSYAQRRGGRAGGFRGASYGTAHRGAAIGPYGGGGYAAHSRGTVVGPVRTGTAGSHRGTYTTGRGTTVNYGTAGRRVTGPYGSAGGAAGGVRVTTPTGRTYTRAGTARGAVGPGGAVGRRTTGGAVTGPGGRAGGVSRGGVAIGPAGAVAGGRRVGAVAGPRGTAVGVTRGGVAAGPHGMARYTVRGGAVAVGHRTAYVPRATLTTRGVYVRRNFAHYHAFAPTWYARHPRAWRPVGWAPAAYWSWATWPRLAAFCVYPAVPVVYGYGSSLVYFDNRVYDRGELVAPADVYATQAIEIAEVGTTARLPAKEEWVSLGVFGMVQGEEKDANIIFQLAINKDGVIRGNYYDALTDSALPVSGYVDRKTQRAAWVVGDKKDTVYETGIANLTEPQTPMLVHFGKDRTQQWTLVRLDPPKGAR